MRFGPALDSLRAGYRVCRYGWNGKNMWLSLTPGRMVQAEHFWSNSNKLFARTQLNAEVEVLPYITMKTADNKIVPWPASQTDILADDWVELPNQIDLGGPVV